MNADVGSRVRPRPRPSKKDPAIKELDGPEAFDTATVLMKFANGKDAVIDVCRQAPYGYDQRAEVLGKMAMIQTDNNYPNTARIFNDRFTGNADMPFDFFMSRCAWLLLRRTRRSPLHPSCPPSFSGS